MSNGTPNNDTPQLKGILFDLDDTLIDWSGFSGDWPSMERRHLTNVYEYLKTSGRALKVSFEDFAREYRNRTVNAWEEARATLRAPHMVRIFEGTLSDFGFVPDDDITYEKCLQVYEWGPVPGVKVFPDVPPMLQEFLDRGVTIGIITNASQPMRIRDHELEGFDLLRFFQNDLRYSAADIGYLKPHPQIFHHVLDVMGAQPSEAIYIGDNPVADVVGAQRAGMRGVLRRTDNLSPLSSDLVEPDGIIDTFYDLPDLLDSWFPGW
ncbi:MAG: HAD family hydrolase [Anaerolineae bacterium]|nr:HAD family hydrolase [Anaerolineae bacterium]MCA9888949.1 HAD family hydrolase [Anaerolineae bacterium]MCA9894595.1 HAD family hydrolase [Anaerolineae bacterium]MCB9460527.1 HAD family hydrolase [Anaerolineaceae bacterium]